jgi:acetyl esterase/lipase
MSFHSRKATGLLIAAVAIMAGLGTPQAQQGKPGDIIRAEPLANAPSGSTAYRILYRSTGLKGEPISVSGVVVIPGGTVPPRGRDIVAWAHPTTGVVPRCAPSLRPGVLDSIPGLHDMLARGYIVAATDYPGLGTVGPHPYLVGISEGRAVLDSVRAARALPQASASNRFAVWGHSQGGHAALYTGQLARRYAPDLQLAGVAAAAPATELAALFDADISTVNGKILTAMTLWSWSQVFGARLDNVVDADVMESINRIANTCIESLLDIILLRFAERPLQRTFLKVDDLTKVEPWRSLMAENTPGPTSGGVPVFLAQGTADSVVYPAVTERYMAALCGRGIPVAFVLMPGVIHAFAARQSATAAVAWIADRFNGAPPPSSCSLQRY